MSENQPGVTKYDLCILGGLRSQFRCIIPDRYGDGICRTQPGWVRRQSFQNLLRDPKKRQELCRVIFIQLSGPDFEKEFGTKDVPSMFLNVNSSHLAVI